MNKNMQFSLEAIKSRNNTISSEKLNKGTANFFEPEIVNFSKKITLRCPHCSKNIKISNVVMCSKSGMMGAGCNLSDDNALIIGNCPICGTRIPVDENGLKGTMNATSSFIKNVLFRVLLVASLLVAAFYFLALKCNQKYYESACAEYGIQNYKTAVSLFEKASIMGNADAMYMLSKCYENGDGVTTDPEKAQSYYQKAESKNSGLLRYEEAVEILTEFNSNNTESLHSYSDKEGLISSCVNKLLNNKSGEAMLLYSHLLRMGIGVNQNNSMANVYLKNAAETENVPALCEYSKMLMEQGSPKSALNVLEAYSKQENADIMAAEGWIYLNNGQAVQGWNMLMSAVEEKSAWGNYLLGNVYYYGITGEQDDSLAEEYYHTAMNLGNGFGEAGWILCRFFDWYSTSQNFEDEEFMELLQEARNSYFSGNADSVLIEAFYEYVNQDADAANADAIISGCNHCAMAELNLGNWAFAAGEDEDTVCQYYQKAYMYGAMKAANDQVKANYNKEDNFFGENQITVGA